MALLPATLISTIGITALTALAFSPQPQSRQIAVIFPPWVGDGFAQVAATGLDIVGAHWRGHVFILDTGGDAAALGHLRQDGFWLLDATGTQLCG